MSTEKELLQLEITAHEMTIKSEKQVIAELKALAKDFKKSIKEKSDQVSDYEYSLKQLRKQLTEL